MTVFGFPFKMIDRRLRAMNEPYCKEQDVVSLNGTHHPKTRLGNYFRTTHRQIRLFRAQQDYFVTEGNGQNTLPSQNSDYDWLQAARNP